MTASDPVPPGGRIEPTLSAFDTSMVVVSLVIGIGIFRTPAIVAARTGTTFLFFAAWTAGGLISLIGALTFMEIGSRFPRPGGYYKVVADCYHPVLAFMLNWAQALMQGAGAAGVAFIGAEYLTPLLAPSAQHSHSGVVACAVGLMVILLVLNLLGIRAGARTQNVLSLLKIAMLLALGAAALLLGRRVGAPPAIAGSSTATGGNSWAALTAAAVAVFYAYGGYQNAMNIGGDVRRARRNLPLAVAAGMLIVTALYLFINTAYQRVLGTGGVARSDLVAAELARACLGQAGGAIVSLAIFVSAAGFVNATILQVPRSYYAMARDRAVPGIFQRVNPRTQVQEFGLVFFGATMLLPALMIGSFEKLLSYVMFTDALTLVVVASTVFVLRRRAERGDTAGGDPHPDTGGGTVFRMPGFPVLPLLFMACLLAVALHVLVHETRLALIGMALLLAGWPLLLLVRWAQGAGGTRRSTGRPGGPSRPADPADRSTRSDRSNRTVD
jgi:APA family basic amino acid/polyamine antiporter